MTRPFPARLALAPLLCSSVLISACGGGDAGSPASTQAAAPATADASTARQRTQAAAAAAGPIDATTLLNWAEGAYPSLFPSHQANGSLDGITYRYYPESGNYVGLMGSTVMVLGPVSGGQLLPVGQVDDFRCLLFPADCAVQSPQNAAVRRIAAGPGYTLVVTAQGAVLGWGDGATGATKVPLAGSVASAVNGLANVAGVYAGGNYALAVTRGGQVLGWGRQYSGLFGLGVTGQPTTAEPLLVPGFEDIVSVAPCGQGSASQITALRADGTLWAIGSVAGRAATARAVTTTAVATTLGHVDPRPDVEACTPLALGAGAVRQVETVSGAIGTSVLASYPAVVSASCSGPSAGGRASRPVGASASGHCLGITAEGQLWTWGSNDLGQLGNGATLAAGAQATPARVLLVPALVKVAVHGKASYGLTHTGQVWAWGEHIGTGTAASRLTPTRLFPQLGAIADIAVNSHVALLMRDGTVVSFGANDQGQLGSGDRVATAQPVQARGVQVGTPADVNLPPAPRLSQASAAATVGVPVSASAWLTRDPNGTPVSYYWTVGARPAGSTAQLSGNSTDTVTLTPDRAGTYRLDLSTSDSTLSAATVAMTITATDAVNVDPLALAQKLNCMACHALDRKLVGPSFKDIAARYKGQPDAQAKLEAKVRNGGAGVWGPIPMPANPGPSPADIKLVVAAILSL